jgi:hypothetical protein
MPARKLAPEQAYASIDDLLHPLRMTRRAVVLIG